MKKTIFITGTDTDVGKTFVSVKLIDFLRSQNYKISAYKPVSAGCELNDDRLENQDALELMKACQTTLPYEVVNPYAFLEPASPHIACGETNIEFAVLDEHLQTHQQNADITLIEGAGGWHVPIAKAQYLSSWVTANKIPVILVVGMKLGCLNHALLTVEAISNANVELIGWVGNALSPQIENLNEMHQFLAQNISAPCLAQIGYQQQSVNFTTICDKPC